MQFGIVAPVKMIVPDHRQAKEDPSQKYREFNLSLEQPSQRIHIALRNEMNAATLAAWDWRTHFGRLAIPVCRDTRRTAQQAA